MSSIQDYIEQHTTPEPELLARITRYTNLHVLNPHMLSGQVQGELLRMLSRMIRPRRILELGTFTGYSALCLAEGLADGGELITVEHNDELEDTIRRNLASSPLGSRIRLIIGDAKQILSDQLSAIAHRASNQQFDLVFIDADKREYCTYYNLVFPLVRPGGFILADNTLWDGHIIDPAYDRDRQTLGLRDFNRQVADDPRVSQVILPVRDGLTLIYKH
ncbi:MAG: O-methyltransferase [Paludibacteraceae bacterium]|nr:O-methyltransferase [Paludibacteraceae bacterium]MBO7455539.1 O-methyltransferase [Paludibacteraceae bacterium]